MPELRNEVLSFIKETYSDIAGEDLKEFLHLLAEGAIPDIQNLEAELAEGNLKSAAEAAHRARNFTLAVGASDLSASLLHLEVPLRKGIRDDAEARLHHLTDDYQKLTELIFRLAAELSPDDGAKDTRSPNTSAG